LLAGTLAFCLLVGGRLLRDFRTHPAGFPAPAPSHGLGLSLPDRERPPS